jgi:twitching motility protein PilI
MIDNSNLLPPEEALNRFQKPDAALLGLDLSHDDYHLPRYGFRVKGLGLMISSEILCEVVKNYKVYPIPNTRRWLKGLVNLRGNLVPVYDLALLLELTDEPIQTGSLLVIDKGQNTVGLLIEGLPKPCDTGNWSKVVQIPMLPAGLTDFITDAYSADDAMWLGFKHNEFFKSVMNSIGS